MLIGILLGTPNRLEQKTPFLFELINFGCIFPETLIDERASIIDVKTAFLSKCEMVCSS
jgi:hypothetical protein